MRPKNKKFNKYHRVKIKESYKDSKLLYGFGLMSLEPCIITDKQIETIVLRVKRVLRRRGKILLRVFAHSSRTRKPIQTRMGKGKGGVSGWEQSIRSGSIILEVKVNKGTSSVLVEKALSSVQSKLGMRTRVVSNKDII